MLDDRKRLTKYSERKTRLRTRSIPVFGNNEDRGKYYRCQHCGFICDIDRDQQSGSDEESGNFTENFVETLPSWKFETDALRLYVVQDFISMHHETVMEYGSDSEIKPILYAHKAEVIAGCPFCGSKLYKG